MSIQFDNAAEAIAAVASVVMSADRVSTGEEQRFLFERVRSLEPFESFDEQAFKGLMGEMVVKIDECLPAENFVVTDEGVKTMLHCACKVLDGDQRRKCFEIALALLYSDGLAPEEEALLERLRLGLQIDEATAGQLLATAADA